MLSFRAIGVRDCVLFIYTISIIIVCVSQKKLTGGVIICFCWFGGLLVSECGVCLCFCVCVISLQSTSKKPHVSKPRRLDLSKIFLWFHTPGYEVRSFHNFPRKFRFIFACTDSKLFFLFFFWYSRNFMIIENRKV